MTSSPTSKNRLPKLYLLSVLPTPWIANRDPLQNIPNIIYDSLEALKPLDCSTARALVLMADLDDGSAFTHAHHPHSAIYLLLLDRTPSKISISLLLAHP